MRSHLPWDDLPEHPGYSPAKRKRDYEAALRVCDHVAREAVLESIYDLCFSEDGPLPLVVAPAMTLHESQNSLAIGYAHWLAHEMGWEADEAIFQARTLSRDFRQDVWFRLVNQPEFYGTVKAGRRYVIADDVCTVGATLANLRGFIESQGGAVICMTTLASRSGDLTPISLAQNTLARLTAVHGGEMDDFCREEIGYELACLTEAEGQWLLRFPSIDTCRAGINGARDG